MIRPTIAQLLELIKAALAPSGLAVESGRTQLTILAEGGSPIRVSARRGGHGVGHRWPTPELIADRVVVGLASGGQSRTFLLRACGTFNVEGITAAIHALRPAAGNTAAMDERRATVLEVLTELEAGGVAVERGPNGWKFRLDGCLHLVLPDGRIRRTQVTILTAAELLSQK